jgi:hypothetical protein
MMVVPAPSKNEPDDQQRVRPPSGQAGTLDTMVLRVVVAETTCALVRDLWQQYKA